MIQGLDAYISTGVGGTFALDEESAQADGYSQEAINMVKHQLSI